MKKLVVLTGAGVSAESGIQTFRDSGGLWEGYNVYEVATPEAWRADREKVLEFYNMRRRAAVNVEPNRAHLELAELESHFDVHVITQNIDDLHERAGSSKILHLHGSLFESRSTLDPNLVYKIEGTELNVGDMCGSGTILIEAAMIANRIPANINRKHFAFENWKDYDEDLYFIIQDSLLKKIQSSHFKIMGFDKAPSAV